MQVRQIPILNYHKIEPQSDIGITSRHPDDFARDMSLVQELGYRTITFRDIVEERLPAKPLLLTFDDGYASVAEYALPVMRLKGLKGVVYVPTDFIGRENFWDVQWSNRRYRHLTEHEMQTLLGAGFELGSHGCSHRALTTLLPKEIWRELQESKRRLEEISGQNVFSLCYPFGRFNEQVLAMARESGYRFGLASVHYRRFANGPGNLALPRFNIYRFDGARSVRRKLNMNFRSALAYRDWLFQQGARATVWYQGVKQRGKDESAI